MVPFFPFNVLFKSTHVVEKYEYCIFWYSSIHQSYNKSTVLIATTIVIQYKKRTRRRGGNNYNNQLQNLVIYLRCESTNEGHNGSTIPAPETTKQSRHPKSGDKRAGLQYHLLTELFSNWWVTCHTGWLLLPQPPRAHARPTLMTTYISVSSYAQPAPWCSHRCCCCRHRHRPYCHLLTATCNNDDDEESHIYTDDDTNSSNIVTNNDYICTRESSDTSIQHIHNNNINNNTTTEEDALYYHRKIKQQQQQQCDDRRRRRWDESRSLTDMIREY